MRISKRKAITIAVVISLLLATYVASFVFVCRRFTVTVDLSYNFLRCRYFSDTPALNKAAYCLFYPCIAATGGIGESELRERSDVSAAAREHLVVYFYAPPNFTR